MSEHPREALQRYPDLLDDHERVALDDHLSSCAECRAWVERMHAVRDAAPELGDARFQVQPSDELDRRVLVRLRAEAELAGAGRGSPWWFAWLAAPGLAAAAAALVLVFHPASPLRTPTPDPGPESHPGIGPDWQPKGDDDDDGPRPELQLAVIEGEGTRPLRAGETVAPDAEILLGGAVPSGVHAAVYVEAVGQRRQVWSGVGDAGSAEGGALLTDGVPTVVRAPASGTLVIEIVRTGSDGGGETPVQRMELGVEEVP